MTNLLLLLSAMLSALIGVGPGARVTQAPVAVASVAIERAVPVAVSRDAVRPSAGPIGVVASLCIGLIVLWMAVSPIPAWATRRRE